MLIVSPRAVLVRRVCSLCVFSSAHTSLPVLTPPLVFFFSLTRLGFLWYGDVAVNPVSAGCDVMTSEMECSARLGGVSASSELRQLRASYGVFP